jgi:hypothetical protein
MIHSLKSFIQRMVERVGRGSRESNDGGYGGATPLNGRVPYPGEVWRDPVTDTWYFYDGREWLTHADIRDRKTPGMLKYTD